MTTSEKRLLEFAELVGEYSIAEKPIIKESLRNMMMLYSSQIINELSDKDKTDGRKKKSE